MAGQILVAAFETACHAGYTEETEADTLLKYCDFPCFYVVKSGTRQPEDLKPKEKF